MHHQTNSGDQRIDFPLWYRVDHVLPPTRIGPLLESPIVQQQPVYSPRGGQTGSGEIMGSILETLLSPLTALSGQDSWPLQLVAALVVAAVATAIWIVVGR